MNKSWMSSKDRWSEEYRKGVDLFIEFAEKNVTPGVDMFCPCMECMNLKRLPTRLVKFHLYRNGIIPTYRIWHAHGETIVHSYNIMQNAVDDQNETTSEVNEEELNDENDVDGQDESQGVKDQIDELNDLAEDLYMGIFENEILDQSANNSEGESVNKFFSLLDDVRRELYPGCTDFTILSFVVKMFHMKVLYKWTDISFNELLRVLKQLIPGCDKKVPWTLYEAKKFLRDLGLGYEIIHACKYDCALFWKENAKLDKCPVCGESRYDEEKGGKIPHKVLRYFPLAPRLKRLYMSRKTATDMRWHKEKRVDDDVLRHPADGEEWKEFDRRYLEFSREARNVRLGLSSDGFNPFGESSSSNSLWPVIVTPYNLPPWKCMKEPFCIMSLLIPGPSAPGNDIDVYLRPLIDELKILWEIGVPTHDATTGQIFQMQAALMWTINDFPAYGNLSGWSTKGYLACPICNEDSSSIRLTDKIGYTGARRFLPKNHPWRKSKLFNGQTENRSRPANLSGEQVFHQLNSGTYFSFGKKNIKRKRDANPVLNWKKKSIFWELPYWKTLKIRHNLDVMHIEKNICDNVLNTLLNSEKSKDTDKARLDLEKLGIRKELHLIKRDNGSGFTKPIALYALQMRARQSFCEFIKSLEYPDGYAANLARSANTKEGKVSGLKSHDCHILLQRILPIGMRGYLDDDICSTLFELGDFFRQLCSKTLRVSDLQKLESNVILILCKLEKIFPPAFFDVMVHLAIHLPREALLGGPLQFRWMYPIERLLGVYKAFVGNKARPEGSIAEKYIAKECTTFCSMYLSGIKTAFNRDERNEDNGNRNASLSAFAQTIRTFGEIVRGPDVSQEELDAAHWFVLYNTPEVEQYLQQFKVLLQNQGVDDIERRQRKEFPKWFRQHINQLRSRNSPEATNELWSLATGPNPIVNLYSACISNGVRFMVHERDNRRKSQNSGVFVMGDHRGKMHEFYGYLSKVWELNYLFGHKVCLFHCEWYNTGNSRSYKTDKHVTTIDIRTRWYRSDPFVFPSHVQQVFYVSDTKQGENWKVVERLQRRGIWDMPELNGEESTNFESPLDDVAIQQEENLSIDPILVEDSNQEDISLNRKDVEDEIISSDVTLRSRKRARRKDVNDDSFINDSDGDPIEQCSEDEVDVIHEGSGFDVDLDPGP